MHVKFQVGMMAKSFSEVHFSIEPAGLVLVVFTVLTVFSEHKLFRMKCLWPRSGEADIPSVLMCYGSQAT